MIRDTAGAALEDDADEAVAFFEAFFELAEEAEAEGMVPMDVREQRYW